MSIWRPSLPIVSLHSCAWAGGRLTSDRGGRALEVHQDGNNRIGHTVVGHISLPLKLDKVGVAPAGDAVHDFECAPREFSLVVLVLARLGDGRHLPLRVVVVVVVVLRFVLDLGRILVDKIVLKVDHCTKHALESPSDQIQASSVHGNPLLAGNNRSC